MKIFINNELRETNTSPTLSRVLEEIRMDATRGIALAVNNTVIPKTEWPNFTLTENDRVTIIKATQGG